MWMEIVWTKPSTFVLDVMRFRDKKNIGYYLRCQGALVRIHMNNAFKRNYTDCRFWIYNSTIWNFVRGKPCITGNGNNSESWANVFLSQRQHLPAQLALLQRSMDSCSYNFSFIIVGFLLCQSVFYSEDSFAVDFAHLGLNRGVNFTKFLSPNTNYPKFYLF